MQMNDITHRSHRLRNGLQALVLIGGMMLVLGLSARLLIGERAFLWTAAMVGLLLLVTPRVSPAFVMRLYGARRLSVRDAPELYRIVAALAERADLPSVPELWYVPSAVLNAFTVGDREHAAIGVSDGLLRALGVRELAGVLAHELSHVRHGDMRVMGLADVVSRLTSSLSLLGQLLVLVNLPLFAMGEVTISWIGLLLLVLAPVIAALLQLALSRTREYDADLGAVELTGDPGGLAAALDKIERLQGAWLERILLPGKRDPNPSLLRTHPPTEERIRRLLEMAPQAPPMLTAFDGLDLLPGAFERVTRRPRWHWNGLWY